MSDSSDQNTHVTSPLPSVSVIGCGGGGVNMVRAAVAHISERARYRYIDTSVSNMRAGENVIVIHGEGSGLVRKQNVDAITQKISSLSEDDLVLSDINIVVFSMSGGSGSVLGPILIREIARRNKLVVAITIASSQSEIHTTNTSNTLKSLEHIATSKNIYLPVMIFNNNAGIVLVDKSLPYKIERLVDILTLPASEIDKNDRMHWINVPKTINASGGLRLIHVDGNQTRDELSKKAELWSGTEGYIFDSVINIRSMKDRHPLTPKARVSYDGMFTTVELTPMLGVIGNPPNAFDKLTTEIDDILQQYKAQSSKKSPSVNISTSDVDPDSGLIL